MDERLDIQNGNSDRKTTSMFDVKRKIKCRAITAIVASLFLLAQINPAWAQERRNFRPLGARIPVTVAQSIIPVKFFGVGGLLFDINKVNIPANAFAQALKASAEGTFLSLELKAFGPAPHGLLENNIVGHRLTGAPEFKPSLLQFIKGFTGEWECKPFLKQGALSRFEFMGKGKEKLLLIGATPEDMLRLKQLLKSAGHEEVVKNGRIFYLKIKDKDVKDKIVVFFAIKVGEGDKLENIIMLPVCAKEANIDRLINNLGNSRFEVREKATKALSGIGTRAIRSLLKATASKDPEVRIRAKKLLQNLMRGKKNRKETFETLVKIGKDAVPVLKEALGDGSDDVRIGAARALGKISDKAAVPTLIKALKDENKDVRYYAASALGEIGDKHAIPALIEKLDADDRSVKASAAKALVRIGKGAVPALVKAMSDEDKWTRTAVHPSSVLADIGKDAVSALTKALKHESAYARYYAVWTLGRIGDISAVEPLKRALSTERDEVVRMAVRDALDRLNKKTERK